MVLTEGQTDLHWLSGLCATFSDAQETDLATASTIFEEPSAYLQKLQTTYSKWTGEILNMCGYGAEYKATEQTDRRMKGLMSELCELEGLALLGPADLAASFAEGKLDFQRRLR